MKCSCGNEFFKAGQLLVCDNCGNTKCLHYKYNDNGIDDGSCNSCAKSDTLECEEE